MILMDMKNSSVNNEIVSNLKTIKIALYLILALLFVNVILVSVNMNKSSVKSDASVNEQEELPEYDVSEFKELDYSQLEDLMSSKGTHVVYIGRESCGYCAMFIPVMKEAQEKFGFETNYFDISRVFDFAKNSVIDNTAYDKLSTLNDFFEENFLATPMVVIFKDGKYVDGTLGYQEIDTYSQFLEKNNFKAK
jgi:predicted bacteriocin transport accessory protein